MLDYGNKHRLTQYTFSSSNKLLDFLTRCTDNAQESSIKNQLVSNIIQKIMPIPYEVGIIYQAMDFLALYEAGYQQAKKFLIRFEIPDFLLEPKYRDYTLEALRECEELVKIFGDCILITENNYLTTDLIVTIYEDS